VDADTLLMSAYAPVSGAAGAVLSSDPSLTAAVLLAAPGAAISIVSSIAILLAGNSANYSQNLRIPLAKGMILYGNSTVGTWLFLLLEDVAVALS
jgi:hypothetical protein